MPRRLLSIAIIASVAACAAVPRDASYHPKIVPADFQTAVDNPWFPLVPGTTYKYVETKDGERVDVVTTVTTQTKTILGVHCIVVHDLATANGKTKEDTLDWYAQDKHGNVWYFGEDTKAYRENGKYTTEGSWEAGEDGAQPGIIMPANPAPGEPYRQEYLAGHAEDKAQVIALNESVKVPYGEFVGALRTKEWSDLEAGSDAKWYARGVGFIRSAAEDGEVAELVAVSKQP